MLLDKASVAHAFNHRYSWLLLDTAASEANGSTACGAESRPQTMLGTAAVLPDADVVWVTRAAALDVYRVAVSWPLVGTELPSPSASTLAEWTALPASAARRRNLAGVRLSAATVVSRPQQFSGWTDVSSRAVDTFPKLTYPLMMLLAEDLNFRYDLRQVDAYGEERNGTFTGLAGLLERGIDIGVASMFMRADRWRALHYAAETVELKGAFIFRQPSQSAVANVFALPFSRGVWVAAGCASCAAGALLAALAALARVAAAPDPALARLTLPDCFTFVVGAICQQGGCGAGAASGAASAAVPAAFKLCADSFVWPAVVRCAGSELAPRLWSLRLVMFCALLSSLFTFTSYAAKVVAILQAPSDALQTIDDLTDSPLALGVQDTTYKKVYFAESEDPATQRLFRRRLAPLGERAYLGVAEGVARVRTGLFAFQVVTLHENSFVFVA
ncbi:Glutamate receptor, ionotropic kainate 4 [Papilio machaon]|uniref:Glutamate receptor, ionotropic kainate 4 n=1 Tax=Papilio machaon TaxID=76193 RepID=A0A0N0PCM2_PAPMA|nr:Glutamate receptor, ionotropic kainate 4 [Papilio machaon]